MRFHSVTVVKTESANSEKYAPNRLCSRVVMVKNGFSPFATAITAKAMLEAKIIRLSTKEGIVVISISKQEKLPRTQPLKSGDLYFQNT